MNNLKPTKLERYLLQKRLADSMEHLTAALKTHANALNVLIAALAKRER